MGGGGGGEGLDLALKIYRGPRATLIRPWFFSTDLARSTCSVRTKNFSPIFYCTHLMLGQNSFNIVFARIVNLKKKQ